MILNVAFYKFVEISPEARLTTLRTELRQSASVLDLRGTVILSPEGINGFLAGTETRVREFLAQLRTHAELSDLATKDSWSQAQPFGKLKIKLKKEIIPMGRPDIRPHVQTGARLEAAELKKWLDEGRDVLLLDTRNTYEIEKGTFVGAKDLGLQTFREFGDALKTVSPEERAKPIVMFCTGGIRCEKATALALQAAGFTDVYQLEGGILRYFEECGGAHYKGGCFVFDERESLGADLSPITP